MTDPKQATSTILKPSKPLLKRIDIGLTTAVCAVFISLLALIVAKLEIDTALEANKIMVMPIIDIDLGYVAKPDSKGNSKQFFEVNISNVGAGIAHIQKVETFQNGAAVNTYKEFEDAVMTGRMRSWAKLTENSAAGFLTAGSTVTPMSFKLGAGESDLSAYLRGKWGKPMDGVDIKVCYCSMYEDECWTVNFLDRKVPQKTQHCGIDDTVVDSFQGFIDQRADARIKK